MPLPTRFTGASYAATLDAMMSALGDANGLRPAPDIAPPLQGGLVAGLSNGQAVAIIQAWRRAAARGHAKWPLWVDLASYALGQRSPGQRFDMSAGHRKAALPDDGVGLLWSSLARLALDLDDSSTVLRPVDVQWTDKAYEQGARDAWEAIKGAAPKLPIPSNPPLPPPPNVPAPPPAFDDVIDLITNPFAPVKRAATDVLVIVALMLGAYWVVTRD